MLGPQESRQVRQTAARLQAGGMTPEQSVERIARARPNVARRDIEVLAGLHGSKPTVVNNYTTHVDGRRDDAETVARKVTETQRKQAKRNTLTRRGGR